MPKRFFNIGFTRVIIIPLYDHTTEIPTNSANLWTTLNQSQSAIRLKSCLVFGWNISVKLKYPFLKSKPSAILIRSFNNFWCHATWHYSLGHLLSFCCKSYDHWSVCATDISTIRYLIFQPNTRQLSSWIADCDGFKG